MCEPRISYSSCPPEWQSALPIFFAVTCGIQALVFLLYFFLNLKLIIRSKSFNITVFTTQLRLTVVVYSLAGALHSGFLITPTPLIGGVASELLYNTYNIVIIGTLILLLLQWVEWCKNPLIFRNADSTKQHVLKFSIIALKLLFAITFVFIIGTDIYGFVIPENRAAVIKSQHHFFTAVCSLTGILNIMLGLVLTRNMFDKSNPAIRKDKYLQWLKFKIQVVYWVNMLLWVTCSLFCAFAANIATTLPLWMLVYSVFNAAGLLVALILWPLVDPEYFDKDKRSNLFISVIKSTTTKLGGPMDSDYEASDGNMNKSTSTVNLEGGMASTHSRTIMASGFS
ncbi:hypothetical protein HK102_005771 [Quaeritorhiza haematococci]|nr:hypothetical protein HK102_005771 [Quaeritorhiza haematococci]